MFFYCFRFAFQIFRLDFSLLELSVIVLQNLSDNYSIWIFWMFLLSLLVLMCALLSPQVFGHFLVCVEHDISIIVSRNHLSPASHFLFAFPRLPCTIAIWDYLHVNLGFQMFWIMQTNHSFYGYSFTFASYFLFQCSTLRSQLKARTVYLDFNFFLLASLVYQKHSSAFQPSSLDQQIPPDQSLWVLCVLGSKLLFLPKYQHDNSL